MHIQFTKMFSVNEESSDMQEYRLFAIGDNGFVYELVAGFWVQHSELPRVDVEGE